MVRDIIPDLSRVIVIGTSCCGKTIFSRRLAALLGQPHIEMDALFWLPNRMERPLEDFADQMEAAVAQDRWVVDGNYGRIREVTTTWPRATCVVWLNYSLVTVMSRALRRPAAPHAYWRRALVRASGIVFRSLSVLAWNAIVVLRTHRNRRLQYTAMRDSARYPQIEWIEFRKPAESERFLALLHRVKERRPGKCQSFSPGTLLSDD